MARSVYKYEYYFIALLKEQELNLERYEQCMREVQWKGAEVEMAFCYLPDKDAYVFMVKDKGRGVQYKAFTKYFSELFEISEIKDYQYYGCLEYRSEYGTREEQAEMRRQQEEELRRKQQEEIEFQKMVANYKGPYVNPNFKWSAIFHDPTDENAFTPVYMRGWISYLQDLYIAFGGLTKIFWYGVIFCPLGGVLVSVYEEEHGYSWFFPTIFGWIIVLWGIGGILMYLYYFFDVIIELTTLYIDKKPADSKHSNLIIKN